MCLGTKGASFESIRFFIGLLVKKLMAVVNQNEGRCDYLFSAMCGKAT